ncbi:MAG: glycosyltransferase [Actinomycetota bacterium]|nr:glycosyltransferase [Actinomycetota bacterium]MDQ6947285.1 glycosyltransferase [Actinomycetota bacterium]
MLRVALLVNSPGAGTYGNAMGRLAAGLAESGRAGPTLVCYKDDPPAPWLTDEVRIHRLGTGRASRSLAALTRYLRAERPDVFFTRQVHANFLGLAATGLARVAGGWSGQLVVGHDHPAELSHASNFLDNKWIAKATYRHADGVIAESPTIRDDAIKWCRLQPSRVGLVPCATPLATRQDFPVPHRWLADETPVFVSTARLVGWKRMDLLVEAFHRLRARHDARLLIVGKGPERENLIAQIDRLGLAGSAETVGWVDDAVAFVAHAAAFVLASDEEGFAQVLTEAMSVRCPVITTDAAGGGPRFVTDDGRCGLLVPRGDVDGLARAMEKVLVPAVRSQYVAAGFERAATFSPLACATTFLDYVETLSPRAPSLARPPR